MAAGAASTVFQKSVDLSGKSLAIFHHRQIGQTAMTPPDTGPFGVNSLRVQRCAFGGQTWSRVN